MGKTQEDVAEYLGCHPNTVARWESTNRKPDTGTIVAYGEAIGLKNPGLLWEAPDTESVDQALRERPELRQRAIEFIEYLRSREV